MLFRRHKSIRSEKLARYRRRIFLIRFGGVCLLALIATGLVSWGLHQPSINISTVVIQGNHVVTNEEINAVVDEVLAGSYWYLFPRRSSLIYPEQELSASILERLKRIKSIELVRTDLHTLSIDVREQQSYALWCRSGKREGQEECYFLNKDGLVYAPAPNFTGNVFFRFYDDLNSGDVIGKLYLDGSFDRITVLIDSIRNLGEVPVALRPLTADDFELHMENGSAILFGRKQRSSEVVDNLKAVHGSETFKNVNGKDIDYIDLRFGNKVYFKLR